MTDERRTPDPDSARHGEDIDAQVEDLTQRIATVIRSAGAAEREGLREYALGLLKEETEVTAPAGAEAAPASPSQPGAIGMAALLALVALPLTLLFAPIGLALLALAGVLGLAGAMAALLRR